MGNTPYSVLGVQPHMRFYYGVSRCVKSETTHLSHPGMSMGQKQFMYCCITFQSDVLYQQQYCQEELMANFNFSV